MFENAYQPAAGIICNPQNADLFSILCNIITQLPDLESFLAGTAGRRLQEIEDGPTQLTMFAPTNRAWQRAALPIDIDYESEFFTKEERNILKTTVQYHVIGNNVVRTFAELECDELFRTMNALQIQIRCATNSRLREQKFVVRPDSGNVLTFSDAKIITKDVEASNGILHAVNNVVIPVDVSELP